MACCATGPCDKSVSRGGAGCNLCDVVAKLKLERCKKLVDGVQCRYVAGHQPMKCSVTVREGKTEAAELKESKPLPDLSAPRAAAAALGRIKRKRVGPHR